MDKLDKLDTFPGIDECIVCLGTMRLARPPEIEAKLMTARPEFRAAVEQHEGTWYICPKCGLDSCVKWHTFDLDDEE